MCKLIEIVGCQLAYKALVLIVPIKRNACMCEKDTFVYDDHFISNTVREIRNACEQTSYLACIITAFAYTTYMLVKKPVYIVRVVISHEYYDFFTLLLQFIHRQQKLLKVPYGIWHGNMLKLVWVKEVTKKDIGVCVPSTVLTQHGLPKVSAMYVGEYYTLSLIHIYSISLTRHAVYEGSINHLVCIMWIETYFRAQ